MRDTTIVVIAGLDPAIHSVAVTDICGNEMDARVEPWHDDRLECLFYSAASGIDLGGLLDGTLPTRG